MEGLSGGQNPTFFVGELCKEIDPDKSYVKVKSDMVRHKHIIKGYADSKFEVHSVMDLWYKKFTMYLNFICWAHSWATRSAADHTN